jgi:hypothetical protein
MNGETSEYIHAAKEYLNFNPTKIDSVFPDHICVYFFLNLHTSSLSKTCLLSVAVLKHNAVDVTSQDQLGADLDAIGGGVL